MIENNKILLVKGEKSVYLIPKQANRHGLIAGATGTGKTVTLKILAEDFSNLQVPVFIADIKGDIAGMAQAGQNDDNIQKRLDDLNIKDFKFASSPVRFFDIFNEKGHPIRTTVSDMGPDFIARILGLTNVQDGVLHVVYRIADDNNLKLIDLKDLTAMLQYVGNHNKEFTINYGNVSKQSIGAILRAVLELKDAGGDMFFNEPLFDINDFITTIDNKGVVNILDCVKLYRSPLLYSTFLLWLLSELFENLPEVGDLDKPKFVFFFDEAHLLFVDAPKALIQQIEQVVKLVRSKGVGIFFITQNPTDIPDAVLSQLGNRVQHALRAYTPNELKNVKAAANSFRTNPNFKTIDVIRELKTGEALVSFLDENGIPSVVEKALICPPQCSFKTISDLYRNNIITSSNLYGKYEKIIDDTTAYEVLTEINQQEIANTSKTKTKSSKKTLIERATTNAMGTLTRETTKSLIGSITGNYKSTKSPFEKATNSLISTISGDIGRSFSRGLFGILKK